MVSNVGSILFSLSLCFLCRDKNMNRKLPVLLACYVFSAKMNYTPLELEGKMYLLP